MSPELQRLIEQSKNIMEAMSPEEKESMFRRQAEGWARSEAEWAKDFREGKCAYD